MGGAGWCCHPVWSCGRVGGTARRWHCVGGWRPGRTCSGDCRLLWWGSMRPDSFAGDGDGGWGPSLHRCHRWGDPSQLLAGEGVALSSAVSSSAGVPHMSTDSSVVVYATLMGVRPGVGTLGSRPALVLLNFSLACSFSRTWFGVRFNLSFCMLVAM